MILFVTRERTTPYATTPIDYYFHAPHWAELLAVGTDARVAKAATARTRWQFGSLDCSANRLLAEAKVNSSIGERVTGD